MNYWFNRLNKNAYFCILIIILVIGLLPEIVELKSGHFGLSSFRCYPISVAANNCQQY
jgi:hypothetical protein